MSKELRWWGTSRQDVSHMPDGVRRQFDTKLRYLCENEPVSGLKPWRGAGPGGRELASGGYRLVISLEFDDAIYALHAFKKDGPRGRKTRHRHSELAKQRYKEVCVDYSARVRKQ